MPHMPTYVIHSEHCYKHQKPERGRPSAPGPSSPSGGPMPVPSVHHPQGSPCLPEENVVGVFKKKMREMQTTGFFLQSHNLKVPNGGTLFVYHTSVFQWGGIILDFDVGWILYEATRKGCQDRNSNWFEPQHFTRQMG